MIVDATVGSLPLTPEEDLECNLFPEKVIGEIICRQDVKFEENAADISMDDHTVEEFGLIKQNSDCREIGGVNW